MPYSSVDSIASERNGVHEAEICYDGKTWACPVDTPKRMCSSVLKTILRHEDGLLKLNRSVLKSNSWGFLSMPLPEILLRNLDKTPLFSYISAPSAGGLPALPASKGPALSAEDRKIGGFRRQDWGGIFYGTCSSRGSAGHSYEPL